MKRIDKATFDIFFVQIASATLGSIIALFTILSVIKVLCFIHNIVFT